MEFQGILKYYSSCRYEKHYKKQTSCISLKFSFQGDKLQFSWNASEFLKRFLIPSWIVDPILNVTWKPFEKKDDIV